MLGPGVVLTQHWRCRMDQQSNNSHPAPHQILKPRRLTLLASVAALSMAVLAVGPGGYRPFNLPAWTTSAQAAEMTQNSPGFADLVAKVKPAVISVRVKIDGDGDNMPVSQRDEGGNPDQSESPFDQFSQRFGFRAPNGMQHHHQMVTGEGSGFFISPDRYVLTNN